MVDRATAINELRRRAVDRAAQREGAPLTPEQIRQRTTATQPLAPGQQPVPPARPGDDPSQFVTRAVGAEQETEPMFRITDPATRQRVMPFLETAAGFMEGLPLGFGDELAAALQTAAGAAGVEQFSPDFSENLRRLQSALAEADQGRRLAGNIAGSVAAGVATAPLLGGGAALPSLARATGVGVLEGGASGFGFATGDVSERLTGAALGAATGGAVGAGATLARPLAARALGPAVRQIRRSASEFGRGTQMAANRILSALRADQLTPEQAIRQLDGIENATLADIPFARNTLGLMRAVEATPGPGQRVVTETLATRAAGRADRIRDFVRNRLSDANFNDTITGLRQSRREVANRLFGIARERGVISSPELNSILNTRPIQRIIRRVMEGVDEQGQSLAGLPQNNIRIIDQVYKELGQQSFTPAGDPVTRLSGRQANNLRLALRNELAELAPEYALALERFAGDRALEEAAEAGARVFTGQDADLFTAAFVRGLTDSEKELFLTGVARAAVQQIDSGGSPTTALRRLTSAKAKRIIAAATESDSAADEFVDVLANELRQARVEGAVISGSPTARIAAEQEELILPSDVAQAVTSPMAAAGNVAARVFGEPARLTPDVSGELARLLVQPPRLTPDTIANQRLLSAILRGGTGALSRGVAAGVASPAGLAPGFVSSPAVGR